VRVEPAEAAVVAELFHHYQQGQQSLVGLTKDLMRQQIPTPSGKRRWNQATVRGILRNPVYTGTVFIGRYRVARARHRQSALRPVGHEHGGHPATGPQEWEAVAQVPAIITQDQFDLVQAKLAQNQQYARRNNTAHPYLLRALVSCGSCHLSCTGRSRKTKDAEYAYYTCRGKGHPVVSCRDEKCRSRFIPAGQLDELVWKDLCDLLTHPQTIAEALHRAQGGLWLPQELQARRENLRKARVSLSQQTERLTDAYLAAVLPLEEYQRRRLELEHRQQGIAEQARQLEVSVGHHEELADMVQSMEAFCQYVQQGLAEATFEQKRHLIELLIDRVVVTDEEVEIRYVIPTAPRSEQIRFCHLRLDYFDLPAHRQHHQRFWQAEHPTWHIGHHDDPACQIECLLGFARAPDRAPRHAGAGVAVRQPPLGPAAGSVARAPAPFGQPARPIPQWLPPVAAGSLAAGDDALFGCRARSPQAAA